MSVTDTEILRLVQAAVAAHRTLTLADRERPARDRTVGALDLHSPKAALEVALAVFNYRPCKTCGHVKHDNEELFVAVEEIRDGKRVFVIRRMCFDCVKLAADSSRVAVMIAPPPPVIDPALLVARTVSAHEVAHGRLDMPENRP